MALDVALCEQGNVTSCVNSTAEFFAHLNSKENVTSSSLRLEATAVLSLDHFLPILLSSLVLDVATSIMQILAILLAPLL